MLVIDVSIIAEVCSSEHRARLKLFIMRLFDYSQIPQTIILLSEPFFDALS